MEGLELTATVEIVDSQRPIRQADIFRAVDETDRTIGMVVTADCDLSNKKTWNILTWIPVIPARSYVLAGLIFEEALALTARHRDQVCAEIQRLREERSMARLSTDALASQIGKIVDVAELVGSSACPDALRASHALLRDVLATMDATPPRMQPWDETNANAVITVVKRLSQDPSRLLSKVQSKLSSLPGDVFLIPDLEASPHIALLRFLRERRVEDVAATVGAARNNGVPFYRFAALKSPYRYELTRRLASVFSDIGLPDSYSMASKSASSAVAGELRRHFG